VEGHVEILQSPNEWNLETGLKKRKPFYVSMEISPVIYIGPSVTSTMAKCFEGTRSVIAGHGSQAV
jgi:hypothetical protein